VKKVKISSRINPYNFDMLRAIADTLFYDEEKGTGNLSEALDWILTSFRLRTKFRTLMEFITHMANYQKGKRTEEDIEAVKQLYVFLKSVENTTAR